MRCVRVTNDLTKFFVLDINKENRLEYWKNPLKKSWYCLIIEEINSYLKGGLLKSFTKAFKLYLQGRGLSMHMHSIIVSAWPVVLAVQRSVVTVVLNY